MNKNMPALALCIMMTFMICFNNNIYAIGDYSESSQIKPKVSSKVNSSITNTIDHTKNVSSSSNNSKSNSSSSSSSIKNSSSSSLKSNVSSSAISSKSSKTVSSKSQAKASTSAKQDSVSSNSQSSSLISEVSEIKEKNESAVESNKLDLPEVDIEDVSSPRVDVSVEEVNKNDSGNLFGSILAWGCIALGLIIVLIVLFSGKNKGEKIFYKNRYRSNHKKLLPDKYYRKKR